MGMRHFDVQLIGGMVLHGGAIAEMKTGEGKTLTGTLAVVLNALAGKGVHVVTVNDYLARRDAEWMSPIYDFLGLTVGRPAEPAWTPRSRSPPTRRTSPTARTPSSASTTCATTWPGRSRRRSSTAAHHARTAAVATHAFAHRRRGRQHPHRRGAHAADHLRRARAGRRPTTSSSPSSRATMKAGKTPEGMDPRTKKEFVADFDFEFDEKHKTVSVTEQGVEKAERFLGIDHLYRAENGPLVNHLLNAAQGRVALQARRRLRRDRRRGQDHRRVHRPHPRRAGAGRRACTRPSRPRRAWRSRRRTRRSPRSRCRTTSACTTSSRA